MSKRNIPNRSGSRRETRKMRSFSVPLGLKLRYSSGLARPAWFSVSAPAQTATGVSPVFVAGYLSI